jgi:membrane-anchored protein YejM (alkaline phosphatase superfamily)
MALLGHMGAFAFVPLLALLPLIIVFPDRRLLRSAATALAAATAAYLLIDSLVFAQDRFHVEGLAMGVLGARTWGFALLYFTIFLGLHGLLAGATERRLAASSGGWASALLPLLVLVGSVLASQLVHVWADVRFYVPVTGFTPVLPLYRPLTAKHLLARTIGAVDLRAARAASQVEHLAPLQARLLDYPKQELRCTPPAAPYNVLLIGIDSMRADMRVPRVAPAIARLASESLDFDEHWSGGNGTRPGLFSLFYGVPATYWESFYAAQRPPVLIQAFQRHGYAMAVFPSNPPDRLVGLDRTAFRTIEHLPETRGDAAVTQGWLAWLAQRDPFRPFFGFLFYESPPGNCGEGLPRPAGVDFAAGGEVARRACYETAVHYADGQVGRVLDDVRARGLLDRTVVIVTSDHGEEFDESGSGFKGHGSALSRYQLHTPMIVHWPGRGKGAVHRRTSHNDVAPTLLKEVLHCENPASDYSSGDDLFLDREWGWLVASSYTSLAVVEPDQITISYGGGFEIRDPSYRLKSAPSLRGAIVAQALRETTRFFGR